MDNIINFFTVGIGFNALILFVITLILSLMATPLVRMLVIKLGMLDQPDARRVNVHPVPRGGGLAVIFSIFMGLWILGLLSSILPSAFTSHRSTILFGGLAIGVIGFIDDKFGMKPILKLVGQILVASFFVYNGICFQFPAALSWMESPLFCYPVTIIWIVGLMNAFNLIDGLDGLASGLAFIACIGLIGSLIVTGQSSSILPYVALMAALLGFLRYNYNPASIFLGDSGSMFIGLMLAVFPLVTCSQDTLLVSLVVPALCAGIPLLDTALAILRRTLRMIVSSVTKGKTTSASQVMSADQDHLHHRLLRKNNLSQRKAVWVLYGLGLALVAIAFLAVLFRQRNGAIFLVAFSAFAYVIVHYMNDVELWDTGKILSEFRSRTISRGITIPVYVVIDLVIFVVSFLLSNYLTGSQLNADLFKLVLLMTVTCTFLMSVLHRNYMRIWGNATRLDEYFVLQSVFCGVVLTFLIFASMGHDSTEMYTKVLACFGLITPMPLIGIRLARKAMLQFVTRIENSRLSRESLNNTQASAIERTLLYGAGVHMNSYLLYYGMNFTHNDQTLIGALDDNPNMRGRYFQDIKILGNLEQFASQIDAYKPTRIVITTPNFTKERLQLILKFAKEHHLKVYSYDMQERSILIEVK